MNRFIHWIILFSFLSVLPGLGAENRKFSEARERMVARQLQARGIDDPMVLRAKDGGRLILPLGNPFSYQNLVLATKRGEDFTVEQITGVLFVPMTGRAQEKGKR